MKERSLRIVLMISVALLLLSTIQVTADIGEIQIRILPESIVYGEYYSLGDIAELDGFDVDVIQMLAKVQIGKSPLPGHSLIVSNGQIKRRIRNKIPNRRVKLSLPNKPLVSRASIRIDKQQLEKIARLEIKKEYETYDEVKITLKTRLKDVFLPKGNVSYQMKRIGKRINVGGNSSWILSLRLDNKEIKKVFIRATVNVFDDVIVAKSGILKGTRVHQTDLNRVRKNISRERAHFTTKPAAVVGQVARRDISRNESLKKSNVGQPVIVRKGSPIKVIYKTKNIFFSNIATAMKSGKRGDIIPVRTLVNRKTIYAIIINSKLAEVAL